MSQEQSKPEALEQVHEGRAGEPGKLIVFHLRTLAHFREERPDVQILSDIGTARLVLFAFKAGQQLQEHRTSSQILVQVLRGRVTVTAAGRSVKLHAGMVLQVEANVPHTVVAQTNAVMLLTSCRAHHRIAWNARSFNASRHLSRVPSALQKRKKLRESNEHPAGCSAAGSRPWQPKRVSTTRKSATSSIVCSVISNSRWTWRWPATRDHRR